MRWVLLLLPVLNGRAGGFNNVMRPENKRSTRCGTKRNIPRPLHICCQTPREMTFLYLPQPGSLLKERTSQAGLIYK